MITHFTANFDDVGRPLAVPADHPGQIAGELPEGWDDTCWDWQPRFDPDGQWVQMVDQKREVLWEAVKRLRQAARILGLPTAKGLLEIDDNSMAALRGRAMRMQRPDAPETVIWTMAGTQAELSKAEFLAMVDAAEDRLNELHLWSQDLRAQIFDPQIETIEALSALDLTCP